MTRLGIVLITLATLLTPVHRRWRLFRGQVPGSVALYEGQVGGHNVLTREAGCEYLRAPGPVGFAESSWYRVERGRVGRPRS